MCVHSARCRPCFFRSAALERIISAAGRDPVHCLPDLHQFITSQSVCTGRVGGGGHQNQPAFALSLHPSLLVVPAYDPSKLKYLEFTARKFLEACSAYCKKTQGHHIAMVPLCLSAFEYPHSDSSYDRGKCDERVGSLDSTFSTSKI